MTIPNLYHFVWYGDRFPTLNRVAIESCVRHCKDARVILWHSDSLDGELEFQRVLNLGVEAKRFLPETFGEFIDSALPAGDVERLTRMYSTLVSHVTRSNLARAAVVHRFGGVYLDIDVLVVRDLAPLREHRGFIGTERIVWPGAAVRGLARHRLGKNLLLDLVRKVSARAPGGERLFLKVERWFPRAVNGAILGAVSHHPLLVELFRNSAGLPEAEWPIKHRLGTHVLQDTVASYRGGDLCLLPSTAFYPLGPEVSRQYFAVRAAPERAARRLLTTDTYAIHWYASVSDLTSLTPNQLGRMAKNTLLGYLCSPYVETEPGS